MGCILNRLLPNTEETQTKETQLTELNVIEPSMNAQFVRNAAQKKESVRKERLSFTNLDVWPDKKTIN